jgi:hypothetical protein
MNASLCDLDIVANHRACYSHICTVRYGSENFAELEKLKGDPNPDWSDDGVLDTRKGSSNNTEHFIRPDKTKWIWI